jgi:phage terminase small subunit
MSKLNARQQRFVDEYLVDLNATRAAIRAGYSAKTALQQGPRLLVNVGVQEAIAKAMSKRSKKVEITQERVLLEFARVAFGDIRKVMSWGEEGVTLKSSDELSDDDAAIVSEVSETATEKGRNLKLKTHDKMKALEMVARHLGMFINKERDDEATEQVKNMMSFFKTISESGKSKPDFDSENK